jgi:DNA-directed RNA polymerase subunit RPC12/RpoP
MKYWLRECPRCGGDLREESDVYGRYVSCVQCGYILNQLEETRLATAGSLKDETSLPAAA